MHTYTHLSFPQKIDGFQFKKKKKSTKTVLWQNIITTLLRDMILIIRAFISSQSTGYDSYNA